MTDRELLELVAKASKIDLWSPDPWREQGDLRGLLMANGFDLWNALDDDGDSLLLAAENAIEIRYERRDVLYVYAKCHDLKVGVAEPLEGDKKAVLRRAIVRAAAEAALVVEMMNAPRVAS